MLGTRWPSRGWQTPTPSSVSMRSSSAAAGPRPGPYGRRTGAGAQPGSARGAYVAGLHQVGQRLGSRRRRAGVRPRPRAGSAACPYANLLLVAAGAPGRRRQCDGSTPRRTGNRAALTARQRWSRPHAVPGAALRRGDRGVREEPRDRSELHPRPPCHRHVPGRPGPASRSSRSRGASRVDVRPRAVLSRPAWPLSCAPRRDRTRAGDSPGARRVGGDAVRTAALPDVHLCGPERFSGPGVRVAGEGAGGRCVAVLLRVAAHRQSAGRSAPPRADAHHGLALRPGPDDPRTAGHLWHHRARRAP